MRNDLCKSVRIISVIIFLFFFSYACAQQEQTESRDAEFYFKRRIASYEKGQYDQAISDFSKALDINPRYAEACYNRGNAYVNKGQYDQTISDYNEAENQRTFKPQFLNFRYNIILTLW